jgi:hypothetical protein
MPRSNPESTAAERVVLCLLTSGLLIVLLAGLRPLNRDLSYRPLLLALLAALCLYQLALRPRAVWFALALVLPAPGLFVFIHYYSAVALLPALAQVAAFSLAACLYRALHRLLGAVLPPRSGRTVQLLAALALPFPAVTLPAGRSLPLLLALTLTAALLAVYLERVGGHD